MTDVSLRTVNPLFKHQEKRWTGQEITIVMV